MPHAAEWVRRQLGCLLAGGHVGGWKGNSTKKGWGLVNAAGWRGPQRGCCRWLMSTIRSCPMLLDG